MKPDETTEYAEKLKQVRLSDDVRLRMREELDAYADLHGVRIAEQGRSIEEVQRYSVFALFTNLNTRNMKATLLIALMLTAGGTSFAAQNAVPGDVLYPVKIGVNENVKTAVTFGADAEATLQAQLLKERLEEAETLAKEGKLEGELAVTVRNNIQTQFDRTYLASSEANAEVGSEVRAQIAQSLSTFQSTMESGLLAQADSDVTAEYASDAEVNLNALDASLAMENSADMASDDAGVSMMMATKLAGDIDPATIVESAQVRLESLKKVIAETAELGAEVRAEFEAQLKTASEHMVTAQAELAADAEASAEASAQKANEVLGEIESALSLMGQVEIDMNTGHIIGIDLNGNADGSINNGEGTNGVDGSLDTSGSIDAGSNSINSTLQGQGTLGL